MSDERWEVQRESMWIYGAWHPFDALYVSEEVARIALKYVWEVRFPGVNMRIRRVA